MATPSARSDAGNQMTQNLSLDAVESLAGDCLTASGASPLQAAPVARSIRDAEAEGTRGIGLGYLPWYCGHLRVGKVAGQAVPVVHQPAPGVVQVDARDGFAHPAYEAGEAALIAAALVQGIAMMGITNSYACGVLGYFTSRLARRGLVALMFANASATMAPWGGRRPFFGTNPWSMAAPRIGAPLVLDSSSSATAYVNLAKAAEQGEPIPPHWALDAEGRPTIARGW
jgi:(2R)-3-sulfolactate dehydrogenase (NADP+)